MASLAQEAGPGRAGVAAGQVETANCGTTILRAGGNAVDAAIAAIAGSFVAEPLLSSPAGGGIMTIDVPGAEPAALEFFSAAPGIDGRSPEQLDFTVVQLDFGNVTQEFHIGRGAASVPGAFDGMALASRRFGSMPLRELVAPAVQLARAGVAITEEMAHVFRLLWPVLCHDPTTRKQFSVRGRCPVQGDVLHNRALADTLEEFGQLGVAPPRFTNAVLAEFGPQAGGLIGPTDVDRFGVLVSRARRVQLSDWTVHTSNAVGGALVAVIVEELAQRQPHADQEQEILRYARASARGHQARGSSILPGNTTHMSVADGRGGAVSTTLTNGEGCGYLVGDTGIQMNNFLGEEDINPHGFHKHAPGARLPTMVAPSVARRRDGTVLAVGSGGSNRIRTAVSQVLYRRAGLDWDLPAAVVSPRVHAEDQTVWVECAGLQEPQVVIRALEQRYSTVHAFEHSDFFFGGVHSVEVDAGGFCYGHGDARRGGAAALC